MIPSPPDSHPHSPAAALGSLGLVGIDGREALELLPPVPPLPPHVVGRPTRASSSAQARSNPDALVKGCPAAGWQSYALTPDPSADSLNVRPRSGRAPGSGSSNSSGGNSARESTASSPRKTKCESGDGSLLDSPFLSTRDLMTPPFERSEDEGGMRHQSLSVHLAQQRPLPPAMLGESCPRRTSDDGLSTFPLSPPPSDAQRQTITQPSSPSTPPTPFLRTVKSRTFISMTTTTTTTTSASAFGAHSPVPPLPTGFFPSSEIGDSAIRPRTASTGILDIRDGTSPKKRASRPASVRDWQSDDDDDGDEGLEVTPGGRSGSTRRQGSRPAQTTTSSPTSASRPANEILFPSSPSGFRQHKFSSARSAPDSRTNLAGMLSAALNMSPTSAIAALSAPQDLIISGAAGGDDVSTDPNASASPGAVVSPLPALSKAITAPIAPLAHVLAFVIISLAAAVALSTVLVGSYGLTAWDVTRLRVRDARETLEDGKRRIGAGVERGRRLIDGAVDGARGLAEGLVDSASAGLEDDDNEDDLKGNRGGSRERIRSRTSSGLSSAGSSAGSTPHKPKDHRHLRSSFVGKATASADDLVGHVADSFWRGLKRVVPAAVVKGALEAAEVRLGKRPAQFRKDTTRRRRYDSGPPAAQNSPSGGSGSSSNTRDSHRRTASSGTATPRSPDTAQSSPFAQGESRSTYASTMSTSPPATAAGVRSPDTGGQSTPQSDDDAEPFPSLSAHRQRQRRRSSTLPPRPPLSVLFPSILLTLIIAFGAMAYNLVKRRARSPSADTTGDEADEKARRDRRRMA